MSVVLYELDSKVLEKLQQATRGLDKEEWKGKASQISDYVASWGLLRFWAVSLSKKETGGGQNEDGKSYVSWQVAREVLCYLVGKEFGIKPGLSAEKFRQKFEKLDFEQQVLLAELLIAIGDSIQFWMMRLTEG